MGSIIAGCLIVAAIVSVYFISGKRSNRIATPLGVWLNPPTLYSAPSIHVPTVIADQLLLMPLLSSAPVIYAPTVARGQGLLVPLLSSAPTIYAPTLSLSIKPPLITASQTIYGPVVTRNDGLSLAVPVITASQTIYAPQVNQSVKPSLLTATPAIFSPSVFLGGTPGFALTAPSVSLTSAAGDPPEATITMGADIYAGYYLRIQRSTTGAKNVSDGSYVTPTVNLAHMVMPSEVAALAITNADLAGDGYTDPSGTWYQQYRWEREDGALSNWSNEISGTVTASVATLTQTTGTAKTGNVNLSGSYQGWCNNFWLADCSVKATLTATGKKHFEVTIDGLASNGNGWVSCGVCDNALAVGPGNIFPTPGGSSTPGARIRVPRTSTSATVYYNGTSSSTSIGSVPTVGDKIIVEFDTTANLVKFWYYRTATTTLTQIGPSITLTGANIPTNWVAWHSGAVGNGSGSNADKWTVNYGASAFTVTPTTGYSFYG